MNKKTKTLTTEQYIEIIKTMKEGSSSFRPNERIATALVLEGNLGLRISDILRLRPIDIVRDGDRYRLEITEQKTGKRRVFTVPLVIEQYIENYCLRQAGMTCCFPSRRAPYKSSFILSATIWAIRVSVPTVSANGTPRKFIKITGMTLPLCRGFYSIAPLPSHNAISE